MADKRKSRKRKEEVDEKPSKHEYAVAKYLRSHLPTKKATLLSHKVEYFVASKAVDCLLDSPWATNKKKKEVFFNTRESAVEYLNTMLIHKFFHRARKILVSQKDVKQKKRSSKEREQEKTKESQGEDKKSSSSSNKKKEKSNAKEKESEAKKQDGSGDATKKKEKRKIKLDMHLEQIFVDGNEAYVWIYDPIPTTAWLIGGLLVVGAILLCLFPLWPSSVRKGVYYISVAAAGFLCVIVALIVVRIIIFCGIWLLTFGKHHLWILPNLTEDVGFFESFWPLFKYEYKGVEEKSQVDDKSTSVHEEKSSKSNESGEKDSEREPTDTEESEESGERNQATNGSNEAQNGFEFVSKREIEQSTCRDRKPNRREKSS